MAGRNAIVSTSLPSIREVLSEKEAYLVPPDDLTVLADGIYYALNHKEESDLKAQAAFELVHKYTWDARVDNILKFTQNLDC